MIITLALFTLASLITANISIEVKYIPIIKDNINDILSQNYNILNIIYLEKYVQQSNRVGKSS